MVRIKRSMTLVTMGLFVGTYFYLGTNYIEPRTTFSIRTLLQVEVDTYAMEPFQNRPRVVILTAYKHGGSSIVGSLLAKYHACLYYYEPVTYVYNTNLGTKLWKCPLQVNFHQNGSIRSHTPSEQKMNVDSLKALVQCDLLQAPPSICHSVLIGGSTVQCAGSQKGTFAQFRRMPSSPTTQNLMKQHEPFCNLIGKMSPSQLEACCKHAPYIAMKVLRYEMKTILRVMRQTEGSVMFHLVRDPRGIVNSFIRNGEVAKSHTGRIKSHKLQIMAKKVCKFMSLNLEILRSADRSIASRIKLIRYEDFAKDPLKFTASLYTSLSLDLPPEVRAWLRQAVNSTQNKGKYLRSNSSKTSSRWRTTLSREHRETIDEECLELYTLFEQETLTF